MRSGKFPAPRRGDNGRCKSWLGDKAPAAWHHEASKKDKVYEFIKGPLRLFFFKGSNGQIAVCTSGVRKNGAKADKGSVKAAATLRDDYETAVKLDTLEIINED
ncbi:MAG: hypothetical protein V4679_14735 [Pseudomonadota bacterium]